MQPENNSFPKSKTSYDVDIMATLESCHFWKHEEIVLFELQQNWVSDWDY